MWLPAVGAVLFLTAGLVWALSSPSTDAAETKGSGAGGAAAATATATAPGHGHPH